MKEKTIYDLELNEGMEVKSTIAGGKIEVTRVPGGWVYAFDYPGYHQSPVVFIPWNSEFHGIIKDKKTK